MPSGTLEVLLVGATGIKDTEIFGKGDPYCILTCGRTQARSNTAQDQGSKPVWNQKFTLGVEESTTEICIRIYNKNLLEDDELGSCIIPLSRIYNSGNKLPTTSFSVLRPSGRQQGEIKLSMTFVPKGGLGHGAGAPIQPNLYGPGTPTPYSFPNNMQYLNPNPNPNLGSNYPPPPPPPPPYPPAGPPFGSRPGYGGINPMPYPPPPPPDPYGRPPNFDPYGANTYATTTSGPYGMQPGYDGSKKEDLGSSYGPYGVAPPGPGYGGVGPLAGYPPLGHQYGNPPKHDPYGNPSSQPPMGGYGGPWGPPAAIPLATGYAAQMPPGLKTNGTPPAGYPKIGSCGAQSGGGYIPPANPNDPYGNKAPHGVPGYNVDAAAAGIAALGLAGAAAYGASEHNKIGKTERAMGGQPGYGGYGSQGQPSVGYPALAPGYEGIPGSRGYNQPAPPNYTPAGYPAVYGTQASSRGMYELRQEGCHKVKQGKKDKKKSKKGKRK